MWKPIKNFENEYELSENGEIRTHYQKHGVITPYLTNHGGMAVNLYKDGKYSVRSFAKLMLETFTGESRKYVIHKDKNPCNNKLENLEWSDTKPLTNCLEVFCKETNEVYKSLRDAQRKLGLTSTEVIYSCDSGNAVNGYTLSYMKTSSKDKAKIMRYVENLPNEDWKILENSDDKFMISNKGRVKSAFKLAYGKDGKTYHIKEKLIQPRIVGNRAVVHVRLDSGIRRHFTLPNEVYKHFVNPNIRKVKYIDGNPNNNSVENLRVVK